MLFTLRMTALALFSGGTNGHLARTAACRLLLNRLLTIILTPRWQLYFIASEVVPTAKSKFSSHSSCMEVTSNATMHAFAVLFTRFHHCNSLDKEVVLNMSTLKKFLDLSQIHLLAFEHSGPLSKKILGI